MIQGAVGYNTGLVEALAHTQGHAPGLPSVVIVDPGEGLQ